MILTLTRDLSDASATLGMLEANGKKFATIERPWIPNAHGGLSGEKYKSCVAAGEYRLEQHERPSGEKAFILSNPALDVYRTPAEVPAGREAATRTLVLIHAGNYVHDVIGCIAPGLTRYAGPLGWMVTSSREAMNQLRSVVGNTFDLRLVIKYAPALAPGGGAFGGGGASGTWEEKP